MFKRRSAMRERVRRAPSHTGATFERHLEGTAAQLREWSQSPELVRAGLHHSLYGNEFGRESIVVDPAELVREIGPEAEALVRLWTDVDRAALGQAASDFAGGPVTLTLRGGGGRTVSARQYLDLVHLLAANQLEMAARTGSDCRRLEPLRPLLCAGAVAELDRRRLRGLRRLVRWLARR